MKRSSWIYLDDKGITNLYGLVSAKMRAEQLCALNIEGFEQGYEPAEIVKDAGVIRMARLQMQSVMALKADPSHFAGWN